MRESGEDYLETIYILSKRLSCVRAIDIANELGYSKPSITRALNILKANELIVSDDNHIKLTEQGLKMAGEVYERHQELTRFLVALGVSPENAAKDACRIEHVICQESFECIKKFLAGRV